MKPLLGLVRRFAVESLTAHRPDVCREIMSPEYTLTIGGHRLAGRDEVYLPATVGQLEQFPGLVLTVHDILLGPDGVAMRFTEHGVSLRHGGSPAAWGGIALFEWDGEVLTAGMAEEDYLARRRQLQSGTADPVEPPMLAPWDTPAAAADAATEQVVGTWLSSARVLDDPAVVRDNEWTGTPPAVLLAPDGIEVHRLFAAGARAAFHATYHGRYLGGIEGAPTSTSRVALHVAGLVDVDRGHVVSGRIIRDRAGLLRQLTEPHPRE